MSDSAGLEVGLGLRSYVSGMVKGALDRRYVQIASLDPILRQRDDRSEWTREMRSVDDQTEQRSSTTDNDVGTGAATHGASPGDRFVANENPDELRKLLFTAHRLANESARAIESLLQADVLLRRDIDALTNDMDDDVLSS